MFMFLSKASKRTICHTLHCLLHSSPTLVLSWSRADPCIPENHSARLAMETTLRFLGPDLFLWSNTLYRHGCWGQQTFPSRRYAEWAEVTRVAQGICALSVTALAVANWGLYMKYSIFTHLVNATIKKETGAVYDWASCWVQLNLLFPIRFNVRIKWMLPEIWRRIICQ